MMFVDRNMKIQNAIFLMAITVVMLPAQSKRDMTPEQLSQATLGTNEQQRKAFPPHKVIGNIYSVGTEILGSFLITTPQGHILINSSFEGNVPIIRESTERLGFKFSDVKIVLVSHAHGDHVEGDAMVKQLTGAQVMAMEQEVPALQRIRPGGKDHPIDRVLHDGDTITLGDVTLTAHLTGGHTVGNTTYTMKAQEDGRSYDVVILGGQGATAGQTFYNAGGLTPTGQQFVSSFKFLRSIHCDVVLGSHTSMYDLMEKFPKIGKGPNPYIDPASYTEELDARERVFNLRLAEQKKAVGK
jgi:metallo-beta-lactamase class B